VFPYIGGCDLTHTSQSRLENSGRLLAVMLKVLGAKSADVLMANGT